MSRPVVHFEIVGARPAELRRYHGELFGWRYDVGDAVTEEVSRPGEYGFVDGGDGINGGVCGGTGFTPHVLFYVGVPDVEAALREAERLGGHPRRGAGAPGAEQDRARWDRALVEEGLALVRHTLTRARVGCTRWRRRSRRRRRTGRRWWRCTGCCRGWLRIRW